MNILALACDPMRAINLCSFQDEVMDADVFLTGQAEYVLVDEGDSEGFTDHGLLATGPIHKLILCLKK